MALVSASALAFSASAAKATDVEVLHWWTSGGEAAALNVLKEDLASKGIGWADMPVAGGAGEQAMTVLRARVASGNPPTAVQILGFDLQALAAEDVLGNLDAVAAEEGWNDVIPKALQLRQIRRALDLGPGQCPLHQLGLGQQVRDGRAGH